MSLDSSLLERSICYAIDRRQKGDALRKAHDELEQRVRERTAELAAVNEALQAEIVERKQTQEALERNELHFRNIMDNTLAMMGILDRDGVLVEANRTALDAAGLSLEDVLGKRFEECYWWSWSPDVQERLREAISRAARGESSRYNEIMRVGEERYSTIDFMLSPIFDHEGQVTFLVPSASDITERIKAEEALQDVEWMFVPQEITPVTEAFYGDLTELNGERLILDSVGKAALRDIADDCLSLLGTFCAVYEKNGDYASRTFASGWCRSLDQASRRLCNTTDNREALRSGRWLCHESCWRGASQSCIETGQTVDVGCRGEIRLFAEPIFVKHKVMGCITIGYGAPPWDGEKLRDIGREYGIVLEDLLHCARSYQARPPFIIEQVKWRVRSMARLVGEIVERRLTEEALRESEEQFRRLFDQSPIGAAIVSLDYRFLKVNEQLCRLFGYTEQELLSMSFTDLTYPEDLEASLRETCRLMAGEIDQFSQEKRYVCKNGKLVWGRLSVRLIRDVAGRTLYFLPLLEDISKVKQSEHLMMLQLDIAMGVGATGSLFEAMTWLLAELLKLDGIDSGGAYAVHKETGDLHLIAHRGFSPGFVDSISQCGSDSPEMMNDN